MVVTFQLAFCLSVLSSALACTNMLVSSGASVDGSTHIAYNADSGGLYGSLGHYPAADHEPGSVREIWDWDGSFYLGTIPEIAHTWNVVGNTNEWGLTIGETTFGGRSELNAAKSGGIMDYGSLIWVTLQRSKNAREAITTIDALLQKHGYASDGESFSVGDPKEVWLMEIIGKGNPNTNSSDELGAVWVASRIPDGYVSSHANQCRTRHFSMDDPDNVRFSRDVVSFAQKKGYFPHDAPATQFVSGACLAPPPPAQHCSTVASRAAAAAAAA
jgi:dipeptidase